MSGRYRQGFRSAWDASFSAGFLSLPAPLAVDASVSPAGELAPERSDRLRNKTAAGGTAEFAQSRDSSRGGRRKTEKNFVGMTLAAVRGAFARRSLWRAR